MERNEATALGSQSRMCSHACAQEQYKPYDYIPFQFALL
jgi:hypothetical protein